jgi:hypothetical protein
MNSHSATAGGQPLSRGSERRSAWSIVLTLLTWSAPLIIGVLSVVMMRYRITSNSDMDLDAGGRGFLMLAVLAMPVFCLGASGVAACLVWRLTKHPMVLLLAVVGVSLGAASLVVAQVS